MRLSRSIMATLAAACLAAAGLVAGTGSAQAAPSWAPADTAVIHPGGSKGDEAVLAAAEARGMAVVLTGTRHFRH